jgi:DNA-directed RNA polymerase specialized sigma24 family protein
VNEFPNSTPTDCDCLGNWRRQRRAEALRPVVERYLPLIIASACRRLGDSAQAVEATRAVFLVLARRARWLRRKTVLAGWLFAVTQVVCGKLGGRPARRRWWNWFGRGGKANFPAEMPLRVRMAPLIDPGMESLPAAQRDAVLLTVWLGMSVAPAAEILRTKERRVARRVAAGVKKVTSFLRKRGVVAEAAAVKEALAGESCVGTWPEGLAEEILASIDEAPGKRPSMKLARRTLNALAWGRWRRRVAIGVPGGLVMVIGLGYLAWQIDSRSGHSRSIATFLVWSVKNEGRTVPGLAQEARPWPADGKGAGLNATGLGKIEELYGTTNIWTAHLRFTREGWADVQPKKIAPLPHFLQPDGTVLLRNPEAQRSGLAGVLGFDFHWTRADFEFGGVWFSNVAARIKGNGTYLGSLYGEKCPWKVDLNRFVKGQKLAGTDELTFNNLVNDHSYLSDTLAYEFFRDAGVPAARTAFAYLAASVEERWDRRPLGLYVMVEAIDEDFALERFGSRRTPIFKPVTYELFQDLGDDWSAYEAIYDLKTEATPEQLERVMEFARLVSHAEDGDFARRVGEFLDLERFARYLACEVLLSNYDSFLSNGQNFHVYLDPGSNKFGFIPWDLDLSWGGFFLLGSTRERERASIFHPWVGENRLLERVMAVETFRKLYRETLEELMTRLFVPDRLKRRFDELAQLVREPVAAESEFRLRKFEDALSDKAREGAPGKKGQGANRPAHQLKRFVDRRAVAVREQLDGRSNGVILRRGGRNSTP